MKDVYLKMSGDNIKSKESFLESSSYDYETKKMIKNWDSLEPLYFQFELEEIEESQCFGSLNALSENFKYWIEKYPNYLLETSYSFYKEYCGDFKHSFHLVGTRKESDDEFLLRKKIRQLDRQEE